MGFIFGKIDGSGVWVNKRGKTKTQEMLFNNALQGTIIKTHCESLHKPWKIGSKQHHCIFFLQ